MSKNYTIEDVESLRAKAGVSYEEAVSLLDKYDGDVARALIELEKRGQLGKQGQNVKFNADEAGAWIKRMWTKGMNTRVLVDRKGERLCNLPLLFLLLMLILGPYAVIAALILLLVTGCSVSIQTGEDDKQTILGGEEGGEEEQQEAAPAEEEQSDSDSDDDFPSMTIS